MIFILARTCDIAHQASRNYRMDGVYVLNCICTVESDGFHVGQTLNLTRSDGPILVFTE